MIFRADDKCPGITLITPSYSTYDMHDTIVLTIVVVGKYDGGQVPVPYKEQKDRAVYAYTVCIIYDNVIRSIIL